MFTERTILFRRLAMAWSVIIVLAANASMISAQSTFATVTGTVTDPTGAVIPNATIVITNKRLGTALIVDDEEKLVGIFTDGDLRRVLNRNGDFMMKTASEVMSAQPKLIGPNELAERGLKIMEDHQITALVVVDEQHHPVGIVHIHDILKSKVV